MLQELHKEVQLVLHLGAQELSLLGLTTGEVPAQGIQLLCQGKETALICRQRFPAAGDLPCQSLQGCTLPGDVLLQGADAHVAGLIIL